MTKIVIFLIYLLSIHASAAMETHDNKHCPPIEQEKIKNILQALENPYYCGTALDMNNPSIQEAYRNVHMLPQRSDSHTQHHQTQQQATDKK